MSHNLSRMRSREEQFVPCDVTEQEAFDRYRQLAGPPTPACRRRALSRFRSEAEQVEGGEMGATGYVAGENQRRTTRSDRGSGNTPSRLDCRRATLHARDPQGAYVQNCFADGP